MNSPIVARQFGYAEADAVARIELTRPDKLNSLTFEIYTELRDTFVALKSRDNIRCVTITGQGRGFCSGGDVNDIIGQLLDRDPASLLQFTRRTGDLIRSICHLPKPVVAAVNGIAAGAGAVIALACDFRIAAQSARFAFLFAKVGLTGADMGAAYLLPRVVGLGHANRLLYLGETIGAQEALRIGLVHEVVPDAQLTAAADALAKTLADGPALAHAMTKVQLYAELGMTLDQALEAEAQAQALCMQMPDFTEGYQAFRDRRLPNFRKR